MTKEKYTIPIFFGIAGIMFYGVFGVADWFHSFLRLLVFLVGLWGLHHGYKLIENEYPYQTAQKTRWTVAFLAILILLIGLGISHLYEPVVGYGVGLLLSYILATNIPRIAKIYR